MQALLQSLSTGYSRDIATLFGNSLSDPVMIIYGDSLLSVNFLALAESHQATAADVTILSHQPDF